MSAEIIDFASRTTISPGTDPRTLTIRSAYRATFPNHRPAPKMWHHLEQIGLVTMADLVACDWLIIAQDRRLGIFVLSICRALLDAYLFI